MMTTVLFQLLKMVTVTTYWENSCSFGLRYVFMVQVPDYYLVFSPPRFLEWESLSDCVCYKYIVYIISIGFLIAPFPDHCLLVPFFSLNPVTNIPIQKKLSYIVGILKSLNTTYLSCPLLHGSCCITTIRLFPTFQCEF